MWPRTIQIDNKNCKISKDECEINCMNIVEPMIYISKDQYEIIQNKKFNIQLCTSIDPGVSAIDVSLYFGYGTAGVRKARAEVNAPYLWATEFHNEHRTWNYTELPIYVANKQYMDSYMYTLLKMPHYTDTSNQVFIQRIEIMERALWAKFTTGPNSIKFSIF